MLALLLQIDDAVNLAKETTPYGMAVYSFLVLVLLFAVIYLARELKEEEKYTKEITEKVIELVSKVEDRLPAQQDSADSLRLLNEIWNKIRNAKF